MLTIVSRNVVAKGEVQAPVPDPQKERLTTFLDGLRSALKAKDQQTAKAYYDTIRKEFDVDAYDLLKKERKERQHAKDEKKHRGKAPKAPKSPVAPESKAPTTPTPTPEIAPPAIETEPPPLSLDVLRQQMSDALKLNDFDQVDVINNQLAKREVELQKQFMQAKEKGDEAGMNSAAETLKAVRAIDSTEMYQQMEDPGEIEIPEVMPSVTTDPNPQQSKIDQFIHDLGVDFPEDEADEDPTAKRERKRQIDPAASDAAKIQKTVDTFARKMQSLLPKWLASHGRLPSHEELAGLAKKYTNKTLDPTSRKTIVDQVVDEYMKRPEFAEIQPDPGIASSDADERAELLRAMRFLQLPENNLSDKRRATLSRYEQGLQDGSITSKSAASLLGVIYKERPELQGAFYDYDADNTMGDLPDVVQETENTEPSQTVGMLPPDAMEQLNQWKRHFRTINGRESEPQDIMDAFGKPANQGGIDFLTKDQIAAASGIPVGDAHSPVMTDEESLRPAGTFGDDSDFVGVPLPEDADSGFTVDDEGELVDVSDQPNTTGVVTEDQAIAEIDGLLEQMPSNDPARDDLVNYRTALLEGAMSPQEVMSKITEIKNSVEEMIGQGAPDIDKLVQDVLAQLEESDDPEKESKADQVVQIHQNVMSGEMSADTAADALVALGPAKVESPTVPTPTDSIAPSVSSDVPPTESPSPATPKPPAPTSDDLLREMDEEIRNVGDEPAPPASETSSVAEAPSVTPPEKELDTVQNPPVDPETAVAEPKGPPPAAVVKDQPIETAPQTGAIPKVDRANARQTMIDGGGDPTEIDKFLSTASDDEVVQELETYKNELEPGTAETVSPSGTEVQSPIPPPGVKPTGDPIQDAKDAAHRELADLGVGILMRGEIDEAKSIEEVNAAKERLKAAAPPKKDDGSGTNTVPTTTPAVTQPEPELVTQPNTESVTQPVTKPEESITKSKPPRKPVAPKQEAKEDVATAAQKSVQQTGTVDHHTFWKNVQSDPNFKYNMMNDDYAEIVYEIYQLLKRKHTQSSLLQHAGGDTEVSEMLKNPRFQNAPQMGPDQEVMDDYFSSGSSSQRPTQWDNYETPRRPSPHEWNRMPEPVSGRNPWDYWRAYALSQKMVKTASQTETVILRPILGSAFQTVWMR